MYPGEIPREDILEEYSRNILEHYNIPQERISKFFNSALQLYWLLLGSHEDVVEVGIDFDYDPLSEILDMSFVLPSQFYGSERRDLTICIEELSGDLPNHVRAEIIVDIFDQDFDEEDETNPESLLSPETLSMRTTLFHQGELFYPSELVVQIDDEERGTYYFLKYGRDGMIYTIEAMDPELSNLLGDEETVDEINILTLTDPRDFSAAISYINSQFEGEEEPSECPIVQNDRPLDILYTLTSTAQERPYRLALNGAKVPLLVYK